MGPSSNSFGSYKSIGALDVIRSAYPDGTATICDDGGDPVCEPGKLLSCLPQIRYYLPRSSHQTRASMLYLRRVYDFRLVSPSFAQILSFQAGPSSTPAAQPLKKRPETFSSSTELTTNKRIKLSGAERRIALRNGERHAEKKNRTVLPQSSSLEQASQSSKAVKQASDAYDVNMDGSHRDLLPVHVALAGETGSKTSKKAERRAKYAPPNETKEEIEARTIFVGNLPVDVMKHQVGSIQAE